LYYRRRIRIIVFLFIISFNSLGEELDYVFVSCGGGGLIGGIALYLKYLK
jgi:cysteine synthase